MKAHIQAYGGTPTIFIDDEPVNSLMYWTRNPTVEDTVLFRDAGVHFFSFMGNLSVIPTETVPDDDLKILDGGLERMLLTPENIDQTMDMLVCADPDIKILPRIIMNPPVWWEKQNPDELMVYYNCISHENGVWRSKWNSMESMSYIL